MVESTNNAKNV
jgi:uncharacterized protein with von Willebrand factor type A (vWA) domain